jgi:ATP-binding cassette subfamily B protein
MTPESRERAYLLDLLTEREAAKEVRLFDLAPSLRRRYDHLTNERIAQLRTFLRGRLQVSLAATFAGALGTGVALGALVVLLVERRIGVAVALTAGIAMQQLATRLTTVTGAASRLIESGLFIDDYRAFLALERPLEPVDTTMPRGRRTIPFHGLVVDGVSFAYPRSQRQALDDVTLRVDPGEVVALVGANGSGKTTLVKLVCQLYRPDRGRIQWSGIDATELAPATIRSQTTVLFQDFIRYHLSARDNIAFGRADGESSLAAVVAAAEEAGAHDFISQLPDGYDTRLGLQFFGGHELSVGQWQRLALARAFFRGGDLLILDEPTAALDPRAEHDLFEQIRRLANGRSALLISHRFSSVRSADRIYVLDDGRIVEHGSHTELMDAGGLYAELFTLQATAYLGDLVPTSGQVRA